MVCVIPRNVRLSDMRNGIKGRDAKLLLDEFPDQRSAIGPAFAANKVWNMACQGSLFNPGTE